VTPTAVLSLDPEVLRFRVNQTIRDRWIKPAPNIVGYHVARGEVEKTARTVLDAMLTRPFRNGKFPGDEDYEWQLRRVRYWVRRGRPIRINLGYAPMKNLNAARASHADWAEFFALCHLCAWHNKAQTLYPPGLKIKIVFDDAAVGMANRPERRHMDTYIASVGRLVEALGYNSFIRGTGRHSSFAWAFHLLPFPIARLHLRAWEASPAHKAIIERMDSFARRNLVLPGGLSITEQHRLCREASRRYRLYWEAFLVALWLQRVTFCAHSLVAMYLDGSQHHIRLKGALHLTTLGKGHIVQPWQGEGALSDNGHGQLVPCVLTRERAGMAKTEVGGLDVVELDGFDRIAVAGANTGAAGSPTEAPANVDQTHCA
jgi:hypothetical protein